jgi:PAP2 superfamily.
MNSSRNNLRQILLLLATVVIATNYNQLVKWWLVVDEKVAVLTNSIMGQWQPLDQTLIALSTTTGDILVLSIVCFGFLVHGLMGKHTEIFVSRTSYWIFVGLCCVTTYLLSELVNLGRYIPLESLPGMFDVRTYYGCVLRTHPFSCFPSGHSFAYSFFALMAFKRYPVPGWLFVALFFVTAGIRMALGIHWFTDIVFGGLVMTIVLERILAVTRLETIVLPKIEEFTAFCTNAVVTRAGRLLITNAMPAVTQSGAGGLLDEELAGKNRN